MIVTLVQSPSITLADFKANLEKIILGTMTTTTSNNKNIPSNLDGVIAEKCEVVGTLPANIWSKLADDSFKKIHSDGSQYGIARFNFVYSSNNLDYIGLTKLDESDNTVGVTNGRTYNGNDIPVLSEKISIVITDKCFYIEDTAYGNSIIGNGRYRMIADFQAGFVSTKYPDILHMAASADDDIENTWTCVHMRSSFYDDYRSINGSSNEFANDTVRTFGKKFIVQTSTQITFDTNWFNLYGLKIISTHPRILGGKIIYNSDSSKYSLVTTARGSDNYIAIEG